MPSRRRPALRRGPRILVWILAPLLLLAALALLALPFRDAPAQAEAARAELELATEALRAADVAGAAEAVARARRHTDDLQGSVQGIGGDVWSVLPVVGGAVGDVRRLGNALDDLVAISETGVEVVGQVRGDEAALFDAGNVDLDTLAHVTEQLDSVSARLARAQVELDAVADRRPLVGTRLAEARDAAQERVDPVAEALTAVQPFLDDLPRMLGAEEDRQYLVALLNPAEQRFSGGTPLTFVQMGFDRGRLTLGETVDVQTARGTAYPIYWRKVKGNPFHRGRLRVLTATMAPDWSVSGNELANAWRSLRGRRMSGVVVVDVVALADLVALTGPLEVPGRGTLTGENLVERLVGSYDEYPDPRQRKAVNRALAPVFTQRLLSGVDPVGTGEVLAQAARERRFAVYLRNPEEQALFDDLGLTGRLGPADRDYLGVFTQNLVPSKSDYWHRRTVRSDVTVREDGSAHVRLTVDLHNDSPPYAQPGVDPRAGYFTRWSFLSLLTMLPEGAVFDAGTVDGEPFPIQRRNFYGQTFQRHNIELAPQARRQVVVEYDVPSVAELAPDGSLDYGLALDPQGLVNLQAIEVRVRFPEGYTVEELPPEWRQVGRNGATYRSAGLETAEFFEVLARP